MNIAYSVDVGIAYSVYHFAGISKFNFFNITPSKRYIYHRFLPKKCMYQLALRLSLGVIVIRILQNYILSIFRLKSSLGITLRRVVVETAYLLSDYKSVNIFSQFEPIQWYLQLINFNSFFCLEENCWYFRLYSQQFPHLNISLARECWVCLSINLKQYVDKSLHCCQQTNHLPYQPPNSHLTGWMVTGSPA